MSGTAAAQTIEVPPPSLSPKRVQVEEDATPPAPVIAEDDDEADDVIPEQGDQADVGDGTGDQEPEDVASAGDPAETPLEGFLRQGGLVTGKTRPGNRIRLDNREVAVDENGNFLFGFGRDHQSVARLTVILPSGREVSRTLPIEKVTWKESSIRVDSSKVDGFTEEQLAKIQADKNLKTAARANMSDEALWVSGFEWPEATGCISSPFGYRRIVNGKPRRYHTGVDVAAPDGMSPTDYVGTPVYAPADGIITLAESDMYFEGGLVFIDHGQKLESALMHLSKVHVEAGESVSKGDLVGEIGSTGRVTGPHLHWSLKWEDRLLDATLNVDPKPECTD